MKKMKFIIAVLSIIFAFQSVNVWADNSYSSWAENEIKEALSLGLIPEDLQSNYTEAITREEFCILVVNMLEKVNEDIVASGSAIYFDDTDNESVTSAAALGIVAGVGDNKFNPDGNITRQEASRMLYMACTLGNNYEDFKTYFSDKLNEMNEAVILPHIFTDGTDIQNWGQESINYCYMYGIMQGIGGNAFDPNSTYSREQAYLTVLRVYRLMKDGEAAGDEKTYLYRKYSDDGSWSYINEKGETVIELNSDVFAAYEFWGGYAVVDRGGTLGFSVIDENGNSVAEGLKYSGRYGNLIPLPNENETLNLKTGEIIGECLPVAKADWVLGEGEWLVPVKDLNSGLYGYYDIEGNMREEPKYSEAYAYYNGRAIVRNYGTVNSNTHRIIDRDFVWLNAGWNFVGAGYNASSAAGDTFVTEKDGKYGFISRVGADSGKFYDNEFDYPNVVSARVMTSGDVYVEKADGTYVIYNNTGNEKFESQYADIFFDNNSGVYKAYAGSTGDTPYYRIISKDGNEIITAAADEYGEIGNGCFYYLNNNAITIYTNRGVVFNTITAEGTIADAYSDNGVIFITDNNGGFKAYTYLGEELL
ncbi:MAG: S-layer homology domain-containing protein [Clostridiales bacterium]|nr:S-layer homology domain-containing protein [Clostridiales bacterium]